MHTLLSIIATAPRLRFVGALVLSSGVAACCVMWLVTVRTFQLGEDLFVYRAIVDRWASGDPLYSGMQLAGPYEVTQGTPLYPPVSLFAMFPLFHLPLALWWAIPIGVTIALVAEQKPNRWALAVIAWCLAAPASVRLIAAGNPGMWTMAALAIALQWRPMAAFVLLKPSVFPLALFGARNRAWWGIAVAFVLVSIGLWHESAQWVTAVLNARGERSGPFYSVGDIGLYLVPLTAWLGKRRNPVGAAWRDRTRGSRPSSAERRASPSS